MKNQNVYPAPDVKGIYVLQSIGYRNGSHQLEGMKERNANNKNDESFKAIEAAKEESYNKGRLDEKNFKNEIGKIKGEYSSLIALFQNAVNQLTEKRENIWQESEPEIIKLVLAVSGKIVGEEKNKNAKDVVRYAVKEAISHV